MKILNSQEMREIDQQAINEYGIPGIVLMENAGLQTAELVLNLLKQSGGRNAIILAGKGNNGGDGLVIARHLFNKGLNVETFLLANPGELGNDSSTNYNILARLGSKIYKLVEEKDLNQLMLSLRSGDIVIDAIYGNGFKGGLNNFDSRVVKLVNQTNLPVVAVDIPSGVEADTGRVYGEAIKATHTVTFALPKLGLILEPGREYTGELIVADISIPNKLLENSNLKKNLIDSKFIQPLIRPRPAESHKGSYGHALVIGGSPGLTGAVIMSAQSALVTGAGLVTAALPESLLSIVDSHLVEVMTTPLAEDARGYIALQALPAIENLLGTSSVCLIGPGMSGYPDAAAVVHFLLERSGIPLVIDADGLNALQNNTRILKGRQVPVVLTPHPGEMARLTGKSIEEIQANRVDIAMYYAREWEVTLVLKGNRTIIADPFGNIYINTTGNPGMATAGSGDVLSGIITGLIAQGLKPHDSAIAGVYLHGRAGDIAKERKGERGMLAGDIIQAIPDILSIFERS